MRSRSLSMFVLLGAALLGSCRYDAPFVLLRIDAPATLTNVVQLHVSVDSMPKGLASIDAPSAPSSTALTWPRTLSLQLPAGTHGAVQISVAAETAQVTQAALGTATVSVDGNGKYATTVTLVPTTLPTHCTDGAPSGDETDVDCGGSCAPCDAFQLCKLASDCLTGVCASDMRCDVVSGPPFWKGAPSLPQPCAWLAATKDGTGNVVALGGSSSATGAPDCTNDFTFTPPTVTGQASEWVAGGMYTNPRRGPSGGVFQGSPIVLGGDFGKGDGPDKSFETLTGDTWGKSVRFLNTGRTSFALLSVDGSDLFAVGGYTGNASTNTTEEYTASSMAWVYSVVLPKSLERLAGAVGADSRFYVFGGDTYGMNVALGDVYSFIAAESGWSSRASLPTPRSGAAAALGGDGRIYVVGGDIADGNAHGLTTVEAYAPGIDHWDTAPSLATARTVLGVAAGGDGRVYAIGGLDGTGKALASVEAYGPVLAVSSSHAKVGTPLSVSGSNFAASASVTITLLTTPPVSLGTGTTDAQGNLTAATITVPEGATSAAIDVVDSRSRYHVQSKLSIDPS